MDYNAKYKNKCPWVHSENILISHIAEFQNSGRFSVIKEVKHISWCITLWFLSRETCVKREKKTSKFTVEKSDKLYLNQVIKININNKPSWWHVSLTWCDQNGTLPLQSSFPSHSLSSHKKNIRQKHILSFLKVFTTQSWPCNKHS